MKKIFFFIITVIFLNANEIDKLYDKAQNLEANGEYKEAMLLYKEIGKKQRNINRIYVDEQKQKASEIAKKTINEIEDKETEQTVQQILASAFNLYPYEENFLFPISYDTRKRADRKQTEVKFQISVKKPIFHNLFKMNETINFGYTQTSWWQFYEDSAPFRETNYKPEVL